MLKKASFLFLFSAMHLSFAAQVETLNQAPLSRLDAFSLTNKKQRSLNQSAPQVLTELNQTQEGSKTVKRYQQLFHGIPIVGAQVTVGYDALKGDYLVNGRLIHEISVTLKPGLNKKEALKLAKTAYFQDTKESSVFDEEVRLELRELQEGEWSLTYLVSFKLGDDEEPHWPFYILDAQTGELLKSWDNVKAYQDSGTGGNEKIGQYWYGRDGAPSLEVELNNDTCLMASEKVILVNLSFMRDIFNLITKPYEYSCGSNLEERVNGAYSTMDDAYFFGHVIADMYQKWYGLQALQNSDGSPMPLMMRVHYGRNYANAFWNGQSMSFGDGNLWDFYPLISLDIAAHEATHGFTEQHSGLEYHDESGALNESMSDMAGQAAKAFLLEEHPEFYSRLHFGKNEVSWAIGETVVRSSFGSSALRFMDRPSRDGGSADCLDKFLARRVGALCHISYADLRVFAEREFEDEREAQNFIVHKASGIFNKAFYLLAQKIGIKRAFHSMLMANANYWTPSTGFKDGACGVLHAAKDLKEDLNLYRWAFRRVGIDLNSCKV